MGLFDWLDRTLTSSFLQLAFCEPVGVDLDLECTCECGVDGRDVALPLAAGWLSSALDPQLGRAHRDQHVAVSIFGVVMIVTRPSSQASYSTATSNSPEAAREKTSARFVVIAPVKTIF